MAGSDLPFRALPSGLALRVRLTPKSSTEGLGGTFATADGPALSARVRAAPTDGDANAALIALVAAQFDVPKSCVALTAGQKSRIKTLTILGDSEALVARASTLSTPQRTKTKT